MDGNEEFFSSKGGIAKLCRECKLYDVFSQRFKNNKLPNTHIKGSKRIDYILCSFNILKSINRSGMTAFGDLATSDHRGLYIDLPIESISKPHQPDINQHFQRTLKSSCPRSVRKYKKYLKKEITKREITNRINKLSIIVQTRKLNKMEEKELNNIDACITKIMLDAEKKTSQYQHNSLWSPELHIAIKKFTIWTFIKTQLTTHVSQHSQIKHIQDALEEPINIQ